MQKKHIILIVKVIPKSNLNNLKIHQYRNGRAEGRLKITAPPINGQANKAIIKYLSDFFDIPKSNIKIKLGLTSKHKVIELFNVEETKLLKNLQLPLC